MSEDEFSHETESVISSIGYGPILRSFSARGQFSAPTNF